jgi:hypothetical protein
MTSIGLTLYLFGVVLDDMRESFGASVTTMSLATALWHTVNAGVSAWLGPALARIPIRRVIIARSYATTVRIASAEVAI